MTTEKIGVLRQLQLQVKMAEARRGAVQATRERFKNALFNNAEDLLVAAEEEAKLREEVAALDAALTEADNELKELKKARTRKAKE